MITFHPVKKSLFLGLAVLAMGVFASVSASAAPTLAAGTASGGPGTTVTVPLTFTPGTTGTAALQFTVGLPSGWSLVSATIGSAASSKSIAFNAANDKVILLGNNTTAIGSGVIGSLGVSIPATASGTGTVSIGSAMFSDANGTAISGGTTTNGTVTVTAATQGITINMASPSTVSVAPGGTFTLTYSFNGGPTATSEMIFVHFTDASGNNIFQDPDFYPSPLTTQWKGPYTVTHTITVPAGITGTFMIRAGLFDPVSGNRLALTLGTGVTADGTTRYQIGTLTVGSAPTGVGINMASPTAVSAAPGGTFTLTYTFTGGPTTVSQMVFVHFVNPDGSNAFEDGPFYPNPLTTKWSGAYTVTHTVTVPAGLTGTFPIRAGLYDPATGNRLALTPGAGVTADGTLQYQIGTLTVAGAPTGIVINTASPSTVSVAPGGTFSLTYSFTGGPTAVSEMMFVHFTDASGNNIFQDADFYPNPLTTKWTGSYTVTHTITVPAGLTGTYNIRAGLFDPVSGNRLALTPGTGVTDDGTVRYQIGTLTVGAASQGQSVFTTQIPAWTGITDGAGKNYELGMAFQSAVAGQITAIKFWKDAKETGTHTGHLWSSSGALLATVTFANETASGWQTQALTTPVNITANTTYITSVNTGNAYYVMTSAGLQTSVVNQNLSTIVGTNGRNGPVGKFPTFGAYQSGNYFRDVVFVPSPVGSDIALAVGSDAAEIRVYPNPWRQDRHAGRDIFFDNVAVGSTIKIFTLSGHQVTTLDATATKIGWNRTNDSGDTVASGIYLYLATSPDGSQTRGTFVVIK